jgi:hypothetical protein
MSVVDFGLRALTLLMMLAIVVLLLQLVFFV